MQYVDRDHFWRVVNDLENLPLGSRPLIDIVVEPETTFTTVSIGGRPVGEEISCHRTGKTRHYLTEIV